MNEYTDSEYVEVCPCSQFLTSFSSLEVLIRCKCLKLLEKWQQTHRRVHSFLVAAPVKELQDVMII
jgi:hypothetical protein